MLDALTRGRSETVPSIALAGKLGGGGKSVFMEPLFHIFSGHRQVFNVTQKTCGNFPLLDLPATRVAFLDDYRCDPEMVP